MELLSTIFQYFLDLGAAVFVPIIMIIAGLCVKMKLKDAISAGITLGVAFVGMNLVVGFMKDAITPVATGMLNSTGLQLDIVDGGLRRWLRFLGHGLTRLLFSHCRLGSMY